MKTSEEMVRTAIIYDSSGDANNYQLAKCLAAGAQEAGAEVSVLKIADISEEDPIEATQNVTVAKLEDLEWAEAVILSVSTDNGELSAQLQSFIDATSWLAEQGKLANKVVSVSSSESNATILSLYKEIYEWGAIIVTPDQDGIMMEDVQTKAKYEAKRTVKIAQALTRL